MIELMKCNALSYNNIIVFISSVQSPSLWIGIQLTCVKILNTVDAMCGWHLIHDINLSTVKIISFRRQQTH